MESLKERINKKNIPKHVAIIMDGNGRWAQSKGEERIFGHRSAISVVKDVVNACNEIEIPFLTLYTFSTENWKRPDEEVDSLMELLSSTIFEEAEEIFSKGLKIHVIGEFDQLPDFVRVQLQRITELTKDNKRGNLVLAISYGSQKEILNAVKKISEKVKEGSLSAGEIDEELFARYLYTRGIPPVDLMIRTSGEMRISNFLLWQIAYAELQFLDIMWPDFSREDFFQCILNYQNKERRFGKISQQI